MVGNVAGHQAGNAPLGLEVEVLASAVGGIDGARFQAGSTVNTAYHSFLGQGIEIASHRLRGDGEMFGKLFDTGIPLAADQIDDGILALLLIHVGSLAIPRL
ncbi:hypothetical protein Q427_10890 [Halomonas sp. BC04]|nr:hypothetical protein Q427_10890 [Halomonas sp. BC04]